MSSEETSPLWLHVPFNKMQLPGWDHLSLSSPSYQGCILPQTVRRKVQKDHLINQPSYSFNFPCQSQEQLQEQLQSLVANYFSSTFYFSKVKISWLSLKIRSGLSYNINQILLLQCAILAKRLSHLTISFKNLVFTLQILHLQVLPQDFLASSQHLQAFKARLDRALYNLI